MCVDWGLEQITFLKGKKFHGSGHLTGKKFSREAKQVISWQRKENFEKKNKEFRETRGNDKLPWRCLVDGQQAFFTSFWKTVQVEQSWEGRKESGKIRFFCESKSIYHLEILASCSIPAWQKRRVICSSGQTLPLGCNSWEQSPGVTKTQTKAPHTNSAIWIHNHRNSLIPRGTQAPQRATQSYTLWGQSVTIAVKGTPRYSHSHWHPSWGHSDNKFRRTLPTNNITNTPPRGNRNLS